MLVHPDYDEVIALNGEVTDLGGFVVASGNPLGGRALASMALAKPLRSIF